VHDPAEFHLLGYDARVHAPPLAVMAPVTM